MHGYIAIDQRLLTVVPRIQLALARSRRHSARRYVYDERVLTCPVGAHSFGVIVLPRVSCSGLVSIRDDVIADVPRTDDIEATKRPCPLRFLCGAPLPLASSDQCYAIAIIALEEVDQAVCNRGVEAIIEEPPDKKDRLTIVVEVLVVLRDLVIINQPLPVIGKEVIQPILGSATEVVADGINTSCPLCGGPDALAQVPYFVWVSIVTVLQLSITAMN